MNQLEGEKLANRYRPRFFREYTGQEGTVEIIKQMIAKDLHSQIGNIGIFGCSGSSKTTLAMLYSKATLCINRAEGEYEPCGHCEVCTGEDVRNISHYTIGSSTEAKEAIRSLIELSRQYPTNIGMRADQYRRFIILDEIENASVELLATLYEALEFCPMTTTWVLISMDIDKLKIMNRQAAEALTSRCVELTLSKFTDNLIAESLVNRVEGLDYQAALAIGKVSEGNMRRAWNTLAMSLAIKPIEEITEELILNSKIGGATTESRMEMWQYLAKGKGREVKEIIEKWIQKTTDIKLLGQLLQEDIINYMDKPSIEVQSLLGAIGRWYDSGINYPLTTVIMSHLGAKVIPFPNKEEREKRIEVKNRVVEEVVIREQLKVKRNVTGQPPILLVKSMKELMLYYDI